MWIRASPGECGESRTAEARPALRYNAYGNGTLSSVELRLGDAMKYDRNTVKAWAGDSQWRAFRADLGRYRAQGYSGWGSEGFWALTIFRMQKSLGRRRPKLLWAPLVLVVNLLGKLTKIVTNIHIEPGAEIGPGMLLAHMGPIHIFREVKIGADCAIFQSCTIGAGPRPGGARIGDHVFIGCTSTILGAVTIGDNAVIAANSLVISDVPAGHTAIGVPAKMIPEVTPRYQKASS